MENKVTYPDRVPDYVKDEYIPDTNQVVYGLCTDTAIHVHNDKAWCQARGLTDVVRHGQMVFGYACRIAIDRVTPDEGMRMTHMFTSFRNPTYPNSHIQFQGWKVDDHKVVFKLVDTDTNRDLLINGIFEWK